MAGLNWREVLRWEASGLRTAGAVIIPLLSGQLLGHTPVGLMIALGGLYVTIAV